MVKATGRTIPLALYLCSAFPDKISQVNESSQFCSYDATCSLFDARGYFLWNINLEERITGFAET
jgi:hypothetical protein